MATYCLWASSFDSFLLFYGLFFFPLPQKLGTFAPEQVKGEYRWCTHPNGQPIPATFTEGAVVEPKNCQFYRGKWILKTRFIDQTGELSNENRKPNDTHTEQ